jgi:hypothetical protein
MFEKVRVWRVAAVRHEPLGYSAGVLKSSGLDGEISSRKYSENDYVEFVGD